MVKDLMLFVMLKKNQACPLSLVLFSTVMEVLGSKLRKKKKGIQIGKGEVNWSLFKILYCLHRKIWQIYSKRPLEIISSVRILCKKKNQCTEIKKKTIDQYLTWT